MLEPIILIRGAGDIASGVALRLYQAGLRHILLLECAQPMAVRRHVAFSEAVYEGCMTIEGVTASLIKYPQNNSQESYQAMWAEGCIPILIDPKAQSRMHVRPHILIDATLRKHNTDTNLHDAPLVIGLGPDFCVGRDVHRIIETARGITLGRVIRKGMALPDTGTPHAVQGYTHERIVRAPVNGMFLTLLDIGSVVQAGDMIGSIRPSYKCTNASTTHIFSKINGRVRGLLRSGMRVATHCKVGDIYPDIQVPCHKVSDKALAVGGGVLEAIMENYYTRPRIRNGILQGI